MYNNAIISILIMVWAISLTTFVVVMTWLYPPVISMGTASAFATFFSLPALAVGLYKWRMDKHVESTKSTKE